MKLSYIAGEVHHAKNILKKKKNSVVLLKLNLHLFCDPAMCFYIYIFKKIIPYVNLNACTRTFLVALFIVAQTRNNLNVYQQ